MTNALHKHQRDVSSIWPREKTNAASLRSVREIILRTIVIVLYHGHIQKRQHANQVAVDKAGAYSGYVVNPTYYCILYN